MMRFEYPGVPSDQARRLKRIFKADDDIDDDGAYTETLNYLLNSKHGAALLRRTFPRGLTSIADLENFARQVMRVRGSIRAEPRDSHQPWPDAKPEVTAKGFPMNRADQLESLVRKAGSFAGLCKSVAAGRNGDISERELMLMGTGYAMKKFPGLTPEQAFAKRYGDERMSDEARHFWNACGVIKGLRPARLEPETASGEDAMAVDDPAETLRQLRELLAEQQRRTRMTGGDEDEDNDESDDESDEDDALDELQAKAAALRKRMPHLSEAQCFDRVYSDSANRELAKRERAENGF
jgi:hypothetical protein